MEYLKHLIGDKPIVKRDTQLPEKPATEIVKAFTNSRKNKKIHPVYSIIVFDDHPTMHCPWYLPIKNLIIETPPDKRLVSEFNNRFNSHHIPTTRYLEFNPGTLDDKENLEIAKLVNDWICIPATYHSFEKMPRAWFVIWRPFNGPIFEMELNKLYPTDVKHQTYQYSGQDLQIDTQVRAAFFPGDAYEPVAPQYQKLLDPPTIE